MSDGFPAAAELTFADISIGQTFEIVRSFSAQDVLAFAALSGDYSPLHVDRGGLTGSGSRGHATLASATSVGESAK